MKKLVLISIILLCTIVTMKAQDIADNAIGLRFGGGNGIGVEISYQLKVNSVNRVEMDLGYKSNDSYDSFKLTGIYQWVWSIDDRGLNWYAGVGAGVGSISSNKDETVNEGAFLNADGNIGIEYDFDIPILISLDLRPELGVLGNYGDSFDFDLALAVRYQF